MEVKFVIHWFNLHDFDRLGGKSKDNGLTR